MTPERAPRDEEGKVGRWEPRYWLCECDETPNNIAESERCMFCGTVRPPLPETPAPRVCKLCNDDGVVHSHEGDVLGPCPRCAETPKPSPRFLTDAQVLGKESIAGVDDAGEPTPAEVIAWLSSDNPVGLSTSRHARKMLAVALAAMRAVPVEGRPLAAAITDHPVSVEDAVKLLREAEQELSGGEGNHEILGAECGVMADRLAALATPTPSEDRPDGE